MSDLVVLIVASAGATAGAVGLALAFRAHREISALRSALEGQVTQLKSLGDDFGVLCNSSSNAGDRLVSVERQSRDLIGREELVAEPGEGRLQRAHALIEKGGSAKDLVEICGLAPAEADLVLSLYHADHGSEPSDALDTSAAAPT